MAIPNFSAIITAAGKSERFNDGTTSPVKKEYLKIGDHTVLYSAVLPFLAVPHLQSLIITCPKDQKNECAVALGEIYEHFTIPVIICEGGETRQESVFNALKMLESMGLPNDYIAIHDGARPFLKSELIISGLATAKVYGGSSPATLITDAVKRVGDHGSIESHEDRTGLVEVQTPQIFKYPEILEAHKKASMNGKMYVDDTEIFSDFGQTVGVFLGDKENRKVTFMADIPDAKEQIQNYIELRDKGEEQFKKTQEFQKYLQTAPKIME
jgi:2-C-methyl-D-erythritol 4-phosphate cytidylyltransferase/2-C-methyl-D-erythritol 4-phosphate cytidylyltransferase/2-C-methyl-D-erythritol 2,4-cyclodiphosphate synthase